MPNRRMARTPTPPRRLVACALALATAAATGALGHTQVAAPEIPKGPNVLFGRVLDSGTDAPVPGAVVTLTGYFDSAGHAMTPPQAGRGPGASAPHSAITNPNGDFVFNDLPAAKYSILANAFGYSSSTYPLKLIELNNGGRAVPVTLHISKFASISGTVLDERGDPFVGVPVFALRRTIVSGGLALEGTSSQAETDDRGIYRISQLVPGNYVVGVLSATTSLPAALATAIGADAPGPRGQLFFDLIPTGVDLSTGEGLRIGDSVLQRTGPMPPPPGPDGKMLTYATTFAPGTTDPAEAAVIALASGDQRAAVDLALRLAPAVRVSGIATGPNGPAKNLAVRLLPPSGVDAADFSPAGVATAITDANGAFLFPAVTAGSYTLKAVVVDPGRPGTANQVDVSLWAMQPITIADTDVSGLSVTLRSGLRVSGRVEFKGATALPIGDRIPMFVNLRPVGAHSWRTLSASVAADGSFATTAGDPPGRYFVNTQAPAGWTWQTLTRGGKVIADDMIELDNGDLTGLVLTVSKDANVLSGSIVDANGAGDPEAEVIVFPADSTLWREGIFNTRRIRFARAMSAGAFELSQLPPGDYYVAAVASQVVTEPVDSLFLERLVAGATKITLDEGETKTIQLKTFTPKER